MSDYRPPDALWIARFHLPTDEPYAASAILRASAACAFRQAEGAEILGQFGRFPQTQTQMAKAIYGTAAELTAHGPGVLIEKLKRRGYLSEGR